MAINFPTSLDNFTNPLGTQTLDTPDHAGQHSDANDAIEALEAKIGLGAGTPTLNKILVGSGNGTATWTTTWGGGTGGGTINNATIGTSQFTGGTINSVVVGTPTVTGGTFDNISLRSYTGWVDANETWVYNSADAPTYTFKVSADVSAKYSAGMKIKYTQGGTVNYGILTAAPSVASGTSTMTFYAGTAYSMGTSAISANYYSLEKSPQGFPLTTSYWTVETNSASDDIQGTPTTNQWYNLGTKTITVPVGQWELNYSVCSYVSGSGVTVQNMKTTLSTANNSESDSDLTSYLWISGASGVVGVMQTQFRRKYISLTTKTVYYLNGMKPGATASDNIGFYGSLSKTIIRAICSFL